MSATQVLLIERALADLAKAYEQKPALDWCAELQIAGSGDDGPWVQVTADTINLHYPFEIDPAVKLRSLSIPPLPGMHCFAWKPGLYATLALVEAGDAHWLSAFINSLFTDWYGLKEDYELQSEITEL